MDNCVWLFSINSCSQKYYISVLIGCILIILYFIIFSYILYYYVKKGFWKIGYDRIFEIGFISIISITVIKIIYLLLLLFKAKNLILINMLHEICVIIITILITTMTFTLLNIMMNNIYRKLLKFKLYFIIILFMNSICELLFSFLCGYYFQKNDIKKGIVFLSLQFIFWGIPLIFFGFINIYLLIKYNDIIKKYKIVQKYVFCNIISGFINGFIWIPQSIWLLIKFKDYQESIITFIVSIFWHYGASIIFNALFINMIYHKIFKNNENNFNYLIKDEQNISCIFMFNKFY